MIEMVGKQFGEWKVLKFSHLSRKKQAYWLCRCGLCGKTYIVRGDNLRLEKSTRCIHCIKK
jgi:hypothetical protein